MASGSKSGRHGVGAVHRASVNCCRSGRCCKGAVTQSVSCPHTLILKRWCTMYLKSNATSCSRVHSIFRLPLPSTMLVEAQQVEAAQDSCFIFQMCLRTQTGKFKRRQACRVLAPHCVMGLRTLHLFIALQTRRLPWVDFVVHAGLR